VRRLISGAVILGLCGAALSIWVWTLCQDLPDQAAIKRYRPQLSTEIQDVNGVLILSVGQSKNRIWRPLGSLSPWLIRAVITSEDDTFFEHKGYRFDAIKEAIRKDLQEKRYASGASTITQQLAKNAFLDRDKTLIRKGKEFFLARRIERTLSKRRILELYLNVVEWGEGVYGAETAAQVYFHKTAAELSLAESALLAGMLPNPLYFNPFERYDKVIKKQQHVLGLMENNGIITAEQERTARESLVRFAPRDSLERIASRAQPPTTCFTTTLLEYLEQTVGHKRLYQSVRPISLTLDMAVESELLRQHNQTSGEWVLVAKEEDTVRGFACIGEGSFEDESPQMGNLRLSALPRRELFNENLLLSAAKNERLTGDRQ